MSIVDLLASDKNVPAKLTRAVCAATHTIPAHVIPGTPEWHERQQDIRDQEHADYLRDLAAERRERGE